MAGPFTGELIQTYVSYITGRGIMKQCFYGKFWVIFWVLAAVMMQVTVFFVVVSYGLVLRSSRTG